MAEESPKILSPEEWLPEEWLQEHPHENESCLRAVHCLEHLTRNNLVGRAPAILEFGPIPTYTEHNPNRRAPIGVFAQRNPEASCLGFGHHPVPEGRGEQILGNVQYLQGIVMYYCEEINERILQVFGRSPDIVYGQHVFENSGDGMGRSLPFGPYKLFEQSAGMLNVGGFIVVDNYGGKRYQIARETFEVNWPHSAAMQFVYSYMYGKSEGIYVFQKDDRVVVPRPVLTRKKKKGKD